jgi:Flp pilus assembly protein TadG
MREFGCGFGWRRLARRLGRDRSGAVAPMFALVAIPMILVTGIGIDVSRMVTSRNNLQDALDAAALAIGRLPTNTPTATLKQQAQYWVTANLADKNVGEVTLNLNATPGNIDLSASSSIPTAIVGLMGVKTMGIAAKSTVTWGSSQIELALILDNTGSMSSNKKLTNLVSAATALVDSLSASAASSADPDTLKIGVVPFSMTVNIGPNYQGQSWLAASLPSAYGADVVGGADRFKLHSQMGTTWAGCIEDRLPPYDVQDTPPTSGGTLFVPFFAPDEPDDDTIVASSKTSGKTTTYTYYKFPNNYLADKNTSGDWQAQQNDPTKYTKKPNSGTMTYFADSIGPNAGCKLTPLLRLTNNMTAVKAKLGQMIATGDTEIPVGLAWGWHLLTPNAPFADGKPYGTRGVTKIAVLVTDGENTYGSNTNPNASYYTALGYAWQKRLSSAGTAAATATALDSRLTLLCNNMKAAGIVLYTMPVEVTDKNIKALLQNCATTPDNYIDVANSSGMAAAFSNLAGQISALRLAK